MEIPNFILITIDALRHDHLSCYGYGRVTSPNIDQLADWGIRFQNAITNGGWTQPGMVSLLTSTYPLMFDGCRKTLSSERPSLPAMLSDLGYHTAGFTSNPQVGKPFGYDRGFKVFEDMGPHRSNPWWYRFPGHARLLRVPFSHRLLQMLGKSSLPPAVSCDASVLTSCLTQWLTGKTEPFFAWIHFMDTHFPYQVDRDLATPQCLAASWRKLKALYDSAKHGYDKHLDDRMMENVISDYDQAILWVDENVGKIIHQLESLGLDEATAIIVTSDHGEQFFEHGHWSHLGLYDEIIHVPLIMKIPRWGHSKVVTQLVSHIDIAPTILDFAGVPKDQRMCGKSVKPILFSTNDVPTNELVISEMVMGPETHYVALRTHTHKYIYFMANPEKSELYNLEEDPGERNNLSNKYPQLVKRYRVIVEQHLEQAKLPHPESEEKPADVSEEVVRRLKDLGYLD